jgi:hypothetical protein
MPDLMPRLWHYTANIRAHRRANPGWQERIQGVGELIMPRQLVSERACPDCGWSAALASHQHPYPPQSGFDTMLAITKSSRIM